MIPFDGLAFFISPIMVILSIWFNASKKEIFGFVKNSVSLNRFKLKPGALIVLVDLEGEIGSDEYNTLSAARKNQQNREPLLRLQLQH